MSDANRVSVGLIVESTLGVTPSNPVIEPLRLTGAPDLAFTPKTIASNELRSDRQVSDLALVGAEAGGTLPFELSHQAIDRLVQAAMFSSYTRQPFRQNTAHGAATEISGIASVVVTHTDTSGAGGGAFAVNDLVRFEGFTNAANNGIFTVTARTATTATFTGSGIVNETPPATAKMTRVGRLGASGDIVSTITNGNALTSTALDFTTLGLAVGDWIKIGDAASGVAARSFNTVSCNTYGRITAIAATRLDLFVPSTWAADAGTSKTIALLFGDRLRNDVNMTSFSVEERFTDLSPEVVQLLAGMCVNTLGLTLEPEAIVVGSAGLMGMTASVANPTAPGDYSNIYTGTVTRRVAPAFDVLNCTSNIGTLRRGQNAVSGPNYVLGASLNINNNLRRQLGIGVLGAVGIGVGEFTLTGTLNTYFGDKTLLDAVLANTETGFDFAVKDLSGRGYMFDCPRIKFSEGAPVVQGKNTDVPINLSFQAIRHATLGYTMSVTRFHYLG